MKNFERILKQNPYAVVAGGIGKISENEAVFTLYHMTRASWQYNYRLMPEAVTVRMTRDRIRYKGEKNKTFSEKALLTADADESGYAFMYATEADRKAFMKWSEDLPSEILRLEKGYMVRKSGSMQRKREREANRMQDLFAEPIVDLETVEKRARELFPAYMIVKNRVGTCSACSAKVDPVRVAHAKKMACPECGRIVSVMDLKRRDYQYDSFWIIAPDLRDGIPAVSYFHCGQRIHKDGGVTIHAVELARSIGERNHSRECWVRDSGSSAWYRSCGSHFQRTNIGCGERANWCERGYVIYDQFLAFLHKYIKEARLVPLSQFFVSSDAYVWMEEAGYLKNTLRDANKRRVIRMLVNNHLPRIADAVSVSCSENVYPLNTKGKALKSLLKLNDTKLEDFMASDRSYDTLKMVSSSDGITLPLPDTALCREYVRKAIPKNGLSAGTSFMIPLAGNTLWTVCESVDTEQNILEDFFVSLKGNSYGADRYRMIGKHFYKDFRCCGYEPKVLLPEHLLAAIGDRLPAYFPKSLLNTNAIRKNLLNGGTADMVASLARVYELFDKAGFKKAAGEIRANMSRDDYRLTEFNKYLQPVADRIGSGKLYRTLQIPRRMLSEIDRRTVALDELAAAARVSACDRNVSFRDAVALDRMFAQYTRLSPESVACNRRPLSETLNYIKDNRIVPGEYAEYLKNLQKLNDPMARSTVFPKDFENAQIRAAEAARAKDDAPKIAVMKKIRDALMSDKRIGKFLKTNTQYLVFVPESPFELIQEGKHLHNCLGTYVDRVSEGNTSVFFIREAGNPDAPLYAMEVSKGNMVQLHGVNNCSLVPDHPARKFAEGFVKVLKQIHFDPKAIVQAA